MIRQCAWCGVNMGEKEPMEDKRTSHGICKDCVEKHIKPELEGIKRFKELRGHSSHEEKVSRVKERKGKSKEPIKLHEIWR